MLYLNLRSLWSETCSRNLCPGNSSWSIPGSHFILMICFPFHLLSSCRIVRIIWHCPRSPQTSRRQLICLLRIVMLVREVYSTVHEMLKKWIALKHQARVGGFKKYLIFTYRAIHIARLSYISHCYKFVKTYLRYFSSSFCKEYIQFTYGLRQLCDWYQDRDYWQSRGDDIIILMNMMVCWREVKQKRWCRGRTGRWKARSASDKKHRNIEDSGVWYIHNIDTSMHRALARDVTIDTRAFSACFFFFQHGCWTKFFRSYHLITRRVKYFLWQTANNFSRILTTAFCLQVPSNTQDCW